MVIMVAKVDTRHSSSLPRYAPAVHQFFALSTMSTRVRIWKKPVFSCYLFGGQGGHFYLLPLNMVDKLDNAWMTTFKGSQIPVSVHHVHQYSGTYRGS